ncbi:MAG: diacylglycerol kinase family protein [Dictyoglomus sp.]|nr:diacylglycerol kinase family protein [Dictyoglomus sp.]MCX7941676.1 diacylglycerol kinase family protein [Dictyoglomaceae bacterium]MDW8188172.1 diacylglycerol kinase family protein [Dictyoglomus sp.]
MKTRNFSESLRFSIEGIIWGLKYERNIKIQFFIGLLTVIAGLIFKLTELELLLILLWTGLVISAEFFNTAIEKALDSYDENFSPSIKIIKDLCASAVFILALFATISGLIIFLPRLISFLKIIIFRGV